MKTRQNCGPRALISESTEHLHVQVFGKEESLKLKKRSRISLAIVFTFAVIQAPSADAFTPARPGNVNVRSSNPATAVALQALSYDKPPSEMSDFQKRMKNLVMKPSAKKPPKRKIPDNFRVVKTLDEYKNMINGNKDQIIVVRFYAPWCKACKAIAPSFYRLTSKHKNALFVDVPVEPDNANLHQGLGVPSLPFGHIYHPTGGLVEEAKISKKFFPKFSRAVNNYVEGACDLEEYNESGEQMP